MVTKWIYQIDTNHELELGGRTSISLPRHLGLFTLANKPLPTLP